MQTFEHNFNDVRDYLHHRSPYLMVDKICEVSQQKIVTQKFVTGNESFLQGHFPGAPIFPGAMLQEVTTQSAGILIAARHNPMAVFNTHDPFANEFALGVLVRVSNARYRRFARPGDTLTASIELMERIGDLFDFSGKIQIAMETIMRISFQLSNVPSKFLQGTAIAR
jgi:3-hydroxyacyl-[acyl-carrier-protein] dehydratase